MKTNLKILIIILGLGFLLLFSSGCKYYFTWYDWQSEGMNGNWVLLGNVSPISRTTATVTIEGVEKGVYPLASREVKTPSYPGLMGGPVIVEATPDVEDWLGPANDQNSEGAIIASQRVIYKNSFNEIQGNYFNSYSNGWFCWYDLKSEGMKGDWILVGNASTNTAADVTITIGTSVSSSYVIPPRGRITPFFTGVMDGPVHVECTNGQEIFASQRVIYKDSFSEVWAIPSDVLSDKYYFTWYDQQSAGMSGDWILITNVSTGLIQAGRTKISAPVGETANVQIQIGDWTDPTTYDVPAGMTIYVSYPGKMDGPVQVTSTNAVPIFCSQRVLYKDSFDENTGMSSYFPSTYLIFPWYDQQSAGMTGDWVLVANPSPDMAANVQVRIGIDAPQNITVGPGKVGTMTFPGAMGGIVSVNSDVPVFCSQRAIYKDSFNELWSFIGGPS